MHSIRMFAWVAARTFFSFFLLGIFLLIFNRTLRKRGEGQAEETKLNEET